MTMLGVWTCQRRELRPINFGGTANSQAQEPLGDEEQGFRLKSGRAEGGYEMVAMKDGEPS